MKPLSASVIGGGTGGLHRMSALDASYRFDLVTACDINPNVCRNLEERLPVGTLTQQIQKRLFQKNRVRLPGMFAVASGHDVHPRDAPRGEKFIYKTIPFVHLF